MESTVQTGKSNDHTPALKSPPPFDVASEADQAKIWNANDFILPLWFLRHANVQGRVQGQDRHENSHQSQVNGIHDLSTADGIEFTTSADLLVERFLGLKNPVLTEKDVDFFAVPQVLKLLIGRITLLDLATESQYIDVANQQDSQPFQRLKSSSIQDKEHSTCAVQILVCEAPTNRKLWKLGFGIILESLFRIFSVNSTGDLDHFALVYIFALRLDASAVFDFLMMAPEDGQMPYLQRLLPYLHRDGICQCLLRTLYPASLIDEECAEHFRRVSSLKIMGSVVDVLEFGSVDALNNVMDFVFGLTEDVGKVAHSIVILQELVDNPQLIRRVIQLLRNPNGHRQRAGISFIYSCVCRTQRQLPWSRRRWRSARLMSFGKALGCPPAPALLDGYGESFSMSGLLEEERSKYLDQYHDRVEATCESLSSYLSEYVGDLADALLQFGNNNTSETAPNPRMQQLELLEILANTLPVRPNEAMLRQTVSILYEKGFWTWLHEMFFELPSNSILHVSFFKLFIIGLKSLHAMTVNFFIDTLLASVISRFDEPHLSDIRPFMALVGNTLRLAEDSPFENGSNPFKNSLERIERWPEFRSRVREMAQKQVAFPHKFHVLRPKPFPQCSPVPPGTPIPSASRELAFDTASISDISLDSSTTSRDGHKETSGGDQGSLYSILLGFVEVNSGEGTKSDRMSEANSAGSTISINSSPEKAAIVGENGPCCPQQRKDAQWQDISFGSPTNNLAEMQHQCGMP